LNTESIFSYAENTTSETRFSSSIDARRTSSDHAHKSVQHGGAGEI
jgi:hypothetical protein